MTWADAAIVAVVAWLGVPVALGAVVAFFVWLFRDRDDGGDV